MTVEEARLNWIQKRRELNELMNISVANAKKAEKEALEILKEAMMEEDEEHQ